MLDLNRSDAVYRRYDAMDTLTLFQQLQIGDRMIDDFLRPTLLVGLFKPPEELSAAVTMELLYYYALAHQDSFDVLDQVQEHCRASDRSPCERLCSQHQIQLMGEPWRLA